MDINSIYSEFNKKAQATIEYITKELRQIRTGQVSPSLVEDLEIKAYGGTTTLTVKELASIATEGPTSLIIQPFDPSITQDIERGIQSSPLGLSVSVDGIRIRITTPPLTEEQRQKFVKLANDKIEEGRIQIRGSRDDARKDIKHIFDNKEISEDDKFRAEKEIDDLTKKHNDTLDELKKKKQEDIMTV